MSLFLRLLGEDDKGAALEAAVRSVATGAADARVFAVDPESFGQVPGGRGFTAETRRTQRRFSLNNPRRTLRLCGGNSGRFTAETRRTQRRIGLESL